MICSFFRGFLNLTLHLSLGDILCPAAHFLFLICFISLFRVRISPSHCFPLRGRKKPLRKKKECLEMVTTEELNMIFSKIGNDFHFTEVSAEFAPYRDLKVR